MYVRESQKEREKEKKTKRGGREGGVMMDVGGGGIVLRNCEA